MSTLNLIVFVAVFFGLYFSNITADRVIKKKWQFKISAFLVFFWLAIALAFSNIADIFSDEFVKKNVAHEWQEKVIDTQQIAGISRCREKEGKSILFVGKNYERETYRYSIINEDGSRVREKIYTADCRLLKKTDKNPKIEYVKKVRVYKNPADKKFFGNTHDETDGYYKVYIL